MGGSSSKILICNPIWVYAEKNSDESLRYFRNSDASDLHQDQRNLKNSPSCENVVFMEYGYIKYLLECGIVRCAFIGQVNHFA